MFLLLMAMLLDKARGENWSPYCSFTPLHTLCMQQGTGPDCGNQVLSGVISPNDAAFIVSEHNRLRSRVASGQETRGSPGPQPPAANMMLMEWDEELARVAQSHADRCIFAHECSACRQVSRFGVGQNLFISAQIRRSNDPEWPVAVSTWYNEVDIFNPSNIRPYQYTPAIGHYTQMMWYNSYKIGCGFTIFKQGIWWRKLYTCDYGPGGNIIFSQLYTSGTPCSSCPPGYTTTYAVPSRTLKGEPDTNNITVAEEIKPTVDISGTQMPNGNHSDPLKSVDKIKLAVNVSHSPEVTSKGHNQESKDYTLMDILSSCLLGVRPEFYGLCWWTEKYFSSLKYFLYLSWDIINKPISRPDVIIRCDTDPLSCEFQSYNPSWIVEDSLGIGHHTHAVLEVGEKAWLMYYKQMLEKTICITIFHQLSFDVISHKNSNVPELMVVVRQQSGEVIHINLSSTHGKWEETSMSINNLRNPFIVELLIGPVNYRVSLAIGTLFVTDGIC
ncbi:uncharacterized protein [Palaemon carinicauda]|uniref:uncharacterized protein isoform X2 n=1 Tax=Palaemon carinicauda TaxID=392227 RepID=UPI0035B5F3ED